MLVPYPTGLFSEITPSLIAVYITILYSSISDDKVQCNYILAKKIGLEPMTYCLSNGCPTNWAIFSEITPSLIIIYRTIKRGGMLKYKRMSKPLKNTQDITTAEISASHIQHPHPIIISKN